MEQDLHFCPGFKKLIGRRSGTVRNFISFALRREGPGESPNAQVGSLRLRSSHRELGLYHSCSGKAFILQEALCDGAGKIL